MKGDVILIDFPFSQGGGSKVRPALVVQGNAVRSVNTIIAEITSNPARVGTCPFLHRLRARDRHGTRCQLGRYVRKSLYGPPKSSLRPLGRYRRERLPRLISASRPHMESRNLPVAGGWLGTVARRTGRGLGGSSRSGYDRRRRWFPEAEPSRRPAAGTLARPLPSCSMFEGGDRGRVSDDRGDRGPVNARLGIDRRAS